MKMAILGATKGMGRSLARAAAKRGDQVFLLGRNAEDLEKSAGDVAAHIAGGAKVGWAKCDLGDKTTFESALDAADQALGGMDTLVITAGLFGTQEALEEDLDFAEQVLHANFTGTIVLCEHARRRFLSRGGGKLCVLSSVAGDRGRKPVGIYGASKSGLSHYLEALDHKYRAEGLITVNVKPGFIKTGMTEGLQPPPFAGEPDQVAQDILKALDRGKPMIYTPKAWGLVMFVIRRLPRFVMRKIGF